MVVGDGGCRVLGRAYGFGNIVAAIFRKHTPSIKLIQRIEEQGFPELLRTSSRMMPSATFPSFQGGPRRAKSFGHPNITDKKYGIVGISLDWESRGL